MTVNWSAFASDCDVAIVVLSRDRADVLAGWTDKLASDYVLFYSGAGYEDHEYRCRERVEVPRGIAGRPSAVNFALRHLTERIVILLDDDLRRVYWLGESHMFRLPPELFPVMLMNLTINALDVGAGLFGISEVDVRKASPLAPFHTRAMVGGLQGVVGRGLFYDERQRVKGDYDFCLQALKRDRLIWKDMRYFLAQDRNTLPGGNMKFRTREREEAEVENLRRWWGSDVIRWSDGKGTKRLGIHV